MNEDEVRANGFKNLFKSFKHSTGDAGKRLPLFHDIQIEIGTNAESFEDAVQHVTVLSGDADQTFHIGGV